MMGVQERFQGKLFYAGIDLGKRICQDNALRRIAELVDFVVAETAKAQRSSS